MNSMIGSRPMRARDRILGAVSWWIGLVGLVAGLMRLDPPMHPAARRHCLLGFAGNVVFLRCGGG